MDLLSLIPTNWRLALLWIACCLFMGAACWRSYSAGYDKAQALGQAEIATLRSEHDRAYAQAVEELNNKLRDQARYALTVSQKLETERTDNAKEKAGLRAQIASITRDRNHVFSSDFVRLWNQAIGVGRGHAGFKADNPPGVDGSPGAGKGSGAGVRATGAVTEANVLEFIVYYGERTRNLEAQVNAWIDIAEKEGWHESR